MEYTVTIQPSGHDFPAYDNESILESGLRAGHNMKYQCDNGTCGECKARLISGDIKSMQLGEYVFTEIEKEAGYFLPCSCEPKSDLVIEAGEFNSADDVPYQEIQAKVKKIDRPSEDIIVLQLRTPRTSTLRFLAGQAAVVELPDKSSKTLEIASCPCNGMILEFHIRHHKGDPFTDFLFNELTTGNEVIVKGPTGDFILDEESTRPLLFIAYDTGFASLKSLIEHAIALEMEQEIHLYRITCDPDEDYMHNVCRAWGDAIDNLHYHAFEYCVPLDCEDKDKAKVCSQFLSLLDKGEVGLINGSDVYLSGIDEMVANLGNTLMERGLPEDRLKIQRVV